MQITIANSLWPTTPERLRAAAELVRDLRAKGYQFTLHDDRRGFGLRTPRKSPLSPDLDDQVYELRDEIVHQLLIEMQAEQPGGDDLSLGE